MLWFATVNIPLSKINSPAKKAFFMKHVRNAGSIPQRIHLAEKLPHIQMEFQQQLATILSQARGFTIISEKTQDSAPYSVFNAIAVLTVDSSEKDLKPFFVTDSFPDRSQSSHRRPYNRASFDCHGHIKNEVIDFATDNARYKVKCMCDIFLPLYTRTVHLTC